jgi:hypothetical protein
VLLLAGAAPQIVGLFDPKRCCHVNSICQPTTNVSNKQMSAVDTLAPTPYRWFP